MDLITLALAKAYADKQRLAGTDSVVVEWNDTMPNEIFSTSGNDPRGYFVKASDTAIDLTALCYCSYLATYKDTGETFDETIPGEYLTFAQPTNGAAGTLVMFGDTCLMWVVTGEDVAGVAGAKVLVGTYFCNVDNDDVSISVGMRAAAETIHTIDQKYIPALDSLTLNGADGKQYKLSVDENGALVTAVIE